MRNLLRKLSFSFFEKDQKFYVVTCVKEYLKRPQGGIVGVTNQLLLSHLYPDSRKILFFKILLRANCRIVYPLTVKT